jgi:hypothetical protein
VDGSVAYGVVGVGEGLAAAVVGVSQAIELVPFASLQGGCALVGVGDDAGGGGVDGPAGDGDVVGAGQGVASTRPVGGQGHGVDSGPGVDVGVRQGQGVADNPMAVGPQGTGDDLCGRGEVGEGDCQCVELGDQGLGEDAVLSDIGQVAGGVLYLASKHDHLVTATVVSHGMIHAHH